ncbi:MAG: PaaI family thioesterase [Geobacteraceae bacterium]|nr:PaaI family thioesterase [Geobacteraceae bacterium]
MDSMKEFFSDHDLFAKHSGIELVEVSEGYAVTRMKLQPYHFNAAGTAHGGAIFTLADFAFAVASNSYGTVAMGISTSMNFIKAAKSGILHAVAKEQSRNSKLATYSVMVTDDDNATVAIFQGMVYRKSDRIIPG